jgi:streptogramin lyase
MPEDTRVGTEIGGYRIDRVIGRGGMSVVYLAEHVRLGRMVALKLLAPEFAESGSLRDRFLRESKIAASIDHPNIVPIYDADEADGVLYIAMRYVEGTDMRRVIREEGPLEPDRASAIVTQIAGALDAAHAHGLVHRDVKPGNVLLTKDDHVYVADFGLTKRAVSVSGLTATGELVGTIDYVAPEQIKGDPIDARADVYSLGCLVYEALTGSPPYPRELEVGVLWAHVEELPPKPTQARPDLPAGVDDVVANAMAKDPNERSQRAGDVALALSTVLRGGAPPATVAVARRAKPSRRPRRAPFVLAAASTAAVVAGIGLFLLLGREGVLVPPVNSVARIDADANEFAEAIPVGESPTGVAIGEDGDVWVINQGDSTVNRIDPEAGEASPAKSTLGIPTGIAAGEGAVWITNGFGSQSGTQVVRVDPTDDSVEPAFPSDNAKAIVVAFESIWLADADRDRVLRYDAQDLSAEPTVIPVDDDAFNDAFPRFLVPGSGAATGIWVVNELEDTVIRISPDGNEVADRIQVEDPTAVAANDSGVWVTSEANDRVHRFDPVDGRALRTYQHDDGIPDGPTMIVIGSDGVWVGSDLDPAVARIDQQTSVVDRIAVGGITGGMSVDQNGDVWVTVRPRLG